MKLTAKERHALAELAKPVGQRDYDHVHGRTIHALERKGLFGVNGKPGGALTAAGRAELEVPNIFDGLFDKKPRRSEVQISKKAMAIAKRYAELTPETGYADMNAAIVLAKALLRVAKQARKS